MAAIDMDQFCGSSFWDLSVTWNTFSPRFTACFEQTVLIWIPTVFLILFSPVDLWASNSKKRRPLPLTSPLTLAKVGATLVLVVLELLIWGWGSPLEVSTTVNIQAHTVQTAAYVLFVGLLLYSRKHGVQSSGVQTIFWFLMSCCTALKFLAVMQTALGDGDIQTELFVIDVIYFPTILAQFVLHLFADPGLPQDLVTAKERKKISPEATVSFVSKVLFHWFTPLMYGGFKKPLEYADLWNLNEEDTSKSIVQKFDSKYERDLSRGLAKPATHPSKSNKQKSNGHSIEVKPKKPELVLPKKDVKVVYALMKAFGGPFLVGICFRIIPDLIVFASPQIMALIIAYVETGQNEPLWKGILYAAVLFLAAFCGTLLLAQATHRFYMVGMRARTALVSAIYRKALLLSNAAKRETTLGEISNLMTVDAQRGTEFVQYAYIFYTAPLQIGLCMYFLWGILGPSSFAGLIVMILILPLNAYIAGKLRTLGLEQMKNKDERVKLMNEILSGIKVLKFYAWETCFEDKVLSIRKRELQVMKEAAIWSALTNVVWQMSQFLVTFATFATYVLSDPTHTLNATNTFVSISLFNIMSASLTFLPLIILNLVMAGVAFKRIDRYLNSEEIDTTVVGHDEKEVDPIVIERGTFAWESGELTLKDINMRVKNKSLVGVVGGVGSGKSTLLSAILGELEKVRGRVNTKGTIAYVTQQAWIQNATLRDNILFGKPFDPVLYDRVLDACALIPDLQILPAGDQTEIGEKGINLSGGQKQRVALARATYADSDLYLFDDPLSAVDAHVGRHIFDKLIGPDGILRRKTRVLVTHGIIYLPQMDHIYVMKDGQITRNGTYHQLLVEKGEFADFLKSHITSEDVEALESADLIEDLMGVMDEAALAKLKERKQSHTSSVELYSSTDGTGQQRLRRRTLSSKQDELDKLTTSIEDLKFKTAAGESLSGDKLIEAEHSETDSVKVSVYLDYFKAAGLVFCAGTFVLNLLFQVFAVGANLWLTEWSKQPNETFAETEGFYLGIYAGFGVVQMFAILGASLVMAYGTVYSASTLHFQMLKRILRAPMSFFDTTPIGRIVNRFAKDMDSIDSILPMFIRFWLNGIFTVAAILVVISYSTPIFIAVIVPIMVFYYLVQRFYVATSRQLKRLESVTRSPIYSHFGETITGAATIRAYRQQERFVHESEKKVDHNQISYYASIVANRWLAVRLETIGNVVVLFAALFAVLGRDTMDPGIVGLSITYALQITSALLMLVRFTSDVETNIVAVERVNEYSTAPQEAPFEIPELKPAKSWPEKGEVVFDAYQTRYRPGLELVLRKVSCTINPGEKIGIVGRTGAGKSSLTLALFRIIEAAGGKITIDGQDISRLGLHDIRGRIAIIPQDPVLFSGSLRINLDPFGTFSDETIWKTLELAHLKAFVSTLPAGLSHEISEGGENLSVGQRQLICLARALLRKTKILVLDEATAAVDLDTDDLIQQTIRKEFKDSTVITIAHRLNTILDSTRVIVLDKGEIHEFDSPQNLLKDPKSIFSGMAKDAGI